MVIFEGMAFNEERVIYTEITDNFNSRKVYYDSTLSIYFLPDSLPAHKGHLSFDFPSHDKAITKMNELVSLINTRKEEFLKLQYPKL